MSFNIAIDGPAGAGKSTIARRAAEELGFMYVDTGAMYRTIALYLLRSGTDMEDEKKLRLALDHMNISIDYQDGVQQMYLNGENVTGLIRTEEVSCMSSRSSAKPPVREKLLKLQRDLAARYNVIMDGRDIGTVILPEAQLKVYLTASVEERARRRCRELLEKGENTDLSEIEEDIRERDYRDMHRKTAPLKIAEDAVYVDSSDMTINEVIGRITELARKRMGSADEG